MFFMVIVCGKEALPGIFVPRIGGVKVDRVGVDLTRIRESKAATNLTRGSMCWCYRLTIQPSPLVDENPSTGTSFSDIPL